MVLLPVTVFGLLIVRAMRGERIRAEYEVAGRQREVAADLNGDLATWLFAAGPGSARATAVLHFNVEANHIVFPAFQLTLAADTSPEQRPFDTGPPSLPPTRDAVVTQYFPRVQAFRRDAAAGRNAGAQYFPRLAALVVQPPSAAEGYVVDVQRVLEHANARLAAITTAEPFTATAWIAAQRPSRRPADSVGLAGFPFFEVVFEERPAPAFGAVRGQLFSYSMGLLIVVTVLGSAFMYRAVSQEAKLARLRSDFVAAVSHEFRSPLASILALTERLDRVDDPDRRREYHSIIGQDARRLSNLVTRLLDFALIEEGQKTYSFDRVDLADTTREAVATCRAAGHPDRITLMDGAPHPLWVRADRTALAHAIQNLVDNAAKYSPPDAPILVVCRSTDGLHCVDVQDRGVGIQPSERTKIFEKFYRGRQAASLNAEGVGIGLSLVRHVMERHGGGHHRRQRAGRRQPIFAAPAGRRGMTGMPQRILVIEDEPGLRLALKDELEFEGFQVELASDGHVGLEAILHSRPDLVLLDVMLPGANGFHICEQVRAQGIRTPIILITARDQEADKIRGLGLGADDYVTKPLSLAEVVARIRAVLRRSTPSQTGDVLEAPPIKVDLRKHAAYKGTRELHLTQTEFQILVLLVRHAGDVVTRDDFLKHVWGEDVYVTHRTVDTHVAALRKKIEDDVEHPVCILSVRNAGYRLNANLTGS